MTTASVRTARPARPAAPVDERAAQLAFDAIAVEMDDCRKTSMEIVTLITPLASATELEEAGRLARSNTDRLESLHARTRRAGEPLQCEGAELAEQSSRRLGLATRARAQSFVTWTQLECVRGLLRVADWSRRRTALTLSGWAERDSPMARTRYGADGVPLLAAFLETGLAGLKRAASRGSQAGPELADLLSDLQLVAHAAEAIEWQPRAKELLAPHVKAFKSGLSELAGREGLSMRWTAWCLWSWAEAGRAQANGRFYRKSALEGLVRLQELIPGASARLDQLADRLRRTWKMRESREG